MKSMKDLFRRRVPQIVTLYVAASWGVVQFTDFLTQRYALSPYLVDMILLGALLLLPSVLLVGWFHGAPGRDRAGLAELIGVPTNLIVTFVVLVLFVRGKDLGAITTTVTVTDEEGVTSERVVARSEFRKRITLFFFDAPPGDTASAWLQYGLPTALVNDLAQDQFIDTQYVPLFADRLREAGYDDLTGAPLALAREITRDQHRDRFVTGTVERVEGEIRATVSLHDANRGRLIQERTYTGTDVLEIADRVSVQLRTDLEVPDVRIEGAEDLPVADILTHEPEAYRTYVEAQRTLQVERDFVAGFALLKKAVEIDPTFADAQHSIGQLMAFTGQGGGDFSAMEAAMAHIYRLPERGRFAVKSDYYFLVRQDAEKAFAVVAMWAELFPDDISAYQALVQVQTVRNDAAGVIRSLERIIELDPSQSEVLLQLGDAYGTNGDNESARRTFERYAGQYPDDYRGLTRLAGVARRLGDLEQARDLYERAVLLEPSNVELMVGMGTAEGLLGNFDTALEQFEEALEASRTPEDRAMALQGLESYYIQRGQIRRAIEYMEQRLEEAPAFLPAIQVVGQRLNAAARYVDAGDIERAAALTEAARAEMPAPFAALIPLGELGVNLAREDADLIEATIPAVEASIADFGYEFMRPRVIHAQARVHELRSEFSDAIARYEEQQRASPGDESIPGHLARCYRGLEQYDRAVSLFEERLAVQPYSAALNYELALTYEAMGRPEDARRHLDRAIEVWEEADRSYAPAARAREALQRLGG